MFVIFVAPFQPLLNSDLVRRVPDDIYQTPKRALKRTGHIKVAKAAASKTTKVSAAAAKKQAVQDEVVSNLAM
jgi:hypothetical protein